MKIKILEIIANKVVLAKKFKIGKNKKEVFRWRSKKRFTPTV